MYKLQTRCSNIFLDISKLVMFGIKFLIYQHSEALHTVESVREEHFTSKKNIKPGQYIIIQYTTAFSPRKWEFRS